MGLATLLGLRSTKPFVVGDLSAPLGSRQARSIATGDVGEDVKEGDWVTRWGWLMEWSDGCIRPPELEALRHEGDPLCDAVVRFLQLRSGQDALKALLEYISTTPQDEWDEDVASFWDQIARTPPEGVSAVPYPDLKYTRKGTPLKKQDDDNESGYQTDIIDCHEQLFKPDEAMKRRNRMPEPTLSEGQAVFWRYSAGMFTTLLHFSLAGGFASARIMSVLHETGYLTSPSRDATYRRLMETTQALVDFMGDMTPITGVGWKSAIRVRMLHAQVRLRILDGKSKLRTYSVEKDGIAINQEDMAATLGGFCLAPLWCQRRMGIHLTVQEELAFISIWRHVGYYLGIKPSLLSKYFGTSDPTTATRSHRFFACVAFHLFTPEIPKDPFGTPTYTILHAVAHRPPQDRSTLYHCELSRFLLGKGLADQLAIPRGSWRDRINVQQHAWTSWLSAYFGKYYRPGWEIKRQDLFRRIITLIVAWQLGERRSHFTFKEEKNHEKKISELENEYANGNGNGNGNGESEVGEGPGIEMGIKVGKEVRWQAKLVFAEMGLVLAGLGAVCLYTLWKTSIFIVRGVVPTAVAVFST